MTDTPELTDDVDPSEDGDDLDDHAVPRDLLELHEGIEFAEDAERRRRGEVR